MDSKVNKDKIMTEDTKKRFKGFLKRNQTRKMGKLETIVDKAISIIFVPFGCVVCGMMAYIILVSLVFDVPDDEFWEVAVLYPWLLMLIALIYLEPLVKKLDDKYFKEPEADEGEEEKSLSELISNVDLYEAWSDFKEKKQEK